MREPIADRPEFRIFAHRGSSGAFPENTLLAISKALEEGARWMEIDVQLVEGEIVVFHDRGLSRTTNGKGLLAQSKFEYVRSLDAGRGERIPTLDELLDLVHGRAGVNIELKGAKVAAPVIALLKRRSGKQQPEVIISSFAHTGLRTAMALGPEFPRALIVEKMPENLFRLAEELRVYSIHIDRELVHEQFVSEIHRQGKRCYVFTVNSVEELERVQMSRADGAFTDYPATLLAALNEGAARAI